MIQVKLFSREGCHLCDQAQADLQLLQATIPHKLTVIDIDSDPALVQRYGLEVPVLEVGPYVLKAPFSTQELRMTLGAAADRERHIESLDEAVNQGTLSTPWTKADSFSLWLAKHYMAVFNLFLVFYLGLPFLAPVLMKANLPGPAGLIYRSYGLACHQLAFRSFFLFGEQAAYPRAAAGVPGLLTFQQASGIPEDSLAQDLEAARSFVGNEAMGYKVALCERDVAIYGAILAFGLLFAVTGKKLPGLPWYLWILLGIMPIAADGFSQLLSQPPLDFLPFRESTPYLRSLTGALFGLTTAWFGYPMVEVSMADTREILANKLRRLKTAEARRGNIAAPVKARES